MRTAFIKLNSVRIASLPLKIALGTSSLLKRNTGVAVLMDQFVEEPCDDNSPQSQPSKAIATKPDAKLYRKLFKQLKQFEAVFGRHNDKDENDSNTESDNEKQKAQPERPFSLHREIAYIWYDIYSREPYHHWDDRILVVTMGPSAAGIVPKQEYLTGFDRKLDNDVLLGSRNLSKTADSAAPSCYKPHIPTRLRIIDTVLLEEIRETTGYSQKKNHARPFRSLVYSNKAFEQRLREQEILCEDMMTKAHPDPSSLAPTGEPDASRSLSGEPEADDSTAAEVKLVQARKLRDGLRCLVHFLNFDLVDIMQVRQQIQAGNLAAISFDHLSFLFEPGHTIVSTNPKYQLYRVLRVFGGRQLLGTCRYNDGVRDKVSDLIIDAFYIDYDGKRFRAAPKRIVIPSYNGFCNLTSLMAYPLRFHTSSKIEEERLVERGTRFVKMIQDMHKRYKGLSLKEGDLYSRSEEVRTQTQLIAGLIY